MKKLLLAGLITTMATMSTAGTITINNWGPIVTSWSTDYVDNGKEVHKNPRTIGPGESIRISYDRGRTVQVNVDPWSARYGNESFLITDNTNIIVNFTGTAFDLNKSVEHYEYSPDQDIPGFCARNIGISGNC